MFKSNMLSVADNETLGRFNDAVNLSTAFTIADVTKPYTLSELVNDHTFFMKFDAAEQVKAGRKVEQSVIDWWKSDRVCEEARVRSYYPSNVHDQKMDEFKPALLAWCHERGITLNNVDSGDRNLFDHSKLSHMLETQLGEKAPWHYHNTFDVVSVLKAWGADRYAGIDARELEGMVYHDPRYDSALDWLRLQRTAWDLGIIEVEGWSRPE